VIKIRQPTDHDGHHLLDQVIGVALDQALPPQPAPDKRLVDLDQPLPADDWGSPLRRSSRLAEMAVMGLSAAERAEGGKKLTELCAWKGFGY
jgi:hypothetical protein